MLHHSYDKLLISLANVLVGNRVESASISKAFELICTAAFFDLGFLYESDLSGCLCLKENFVLHPGSMPAPPLVKELPTLDPEFSSQSGTAYLVKRPDTPPSARKLLELYSAESIILTPILDENGALYGLVLLLSSTPDVSFEENDKGMLSAALSMLVRYVGMRMYQRKLHQAQVTLESILDNTGIDIYVNDFNSHEILYVNKSMAAPYGGRQQFIGQKCWQVLFPGQTGPCEFCPQKKLVDSQGLPTKVYTWDYKRPFDGSWFRVFSAAFQWVDGRLAHVVSSADITDNKRNEALVENMANYDQLTKLPNRRMLVKECEQRIDNSTSTEQGYLLFFDIDGFKQINDTLGHDAGDEFLVQLGGFFSGIPLLKDAIYRNGGDEFVAIIGGEMVTKTNIRSLAHFISERFKRPWMLKKGEIFCSTSIGVACYPEDGDKAEVLLQKADMAMYHVKKAGGGGLCFGYELGNAAAGTK